MGDNFVLRFVVEFFFDDEDDDNTRHIVEKVANYAEEVIPRYTDRQFQSHFRMSPQTFENLLIRLSTLVENNIVGRAGGNAEVCLEKQLLVALWYLANIESFRGVADRFGLSKSTAWRCVHNICNQILNLNMQYHILWFPNEEQCNTSIANFARKNGFPGIVGAIDGSHIPIKAPIRNPASYINRKNFHSVLLQGVCDSKKFFFDCYAGEAGSIHDACLFRRSELGQNMGNRQFPQNGHLIGDSAYPLLTQLLVPFKDNGHLTNIQRNFNRKLSQNRVIIENAFALLKGRFRRLKLMEIVRLDLLPAMIIAACILHNICLENDDIPVDINLEAEVEEERLMNPHNLEINVRGNNPLAVAKRNNIANLLYMQ